MKSCLAQLPHLTGQWKFSTTATHSIACTPVQIVLPGIIGGRELKAWVRGGNVKGEVRWEKCDIDNQGSVARGGRTQSIRCGATLGIHCWSGYLSAWEGVEGRTFGAGLRWGGREKQK